MSASSILVIGGSGFIGSHLVAKLGGSGYRITLPTRRLAHANHLALLPGVENIVETNVHDDAALEKLIRNQDAVINLVGILHDKPGKRGSRYGAGFARVHVDLPRRIAAACVRLGVKRYLHMSALGVAPDAPSMYLRSKADGEAAAFSQPSLATTAFRPSVVFGEEDHFLNLFAQLQKFAPVMLLAGANAKFQPVYVQDVAQAFIHALENDRTAGHVFELGGPHIYTLRELVRLAGRYSGHPRPIIALPDLLGRLQAGVLEHMPGGPLMSRDNLDSMKVDNVVSRDGFQELGIDPTALEAVASFYLSGSSVRGNVEVTAVDRR